MTIESERVMVLVNKEIKGVEEKNMLEDVMFVTTMKLNILYKTSLGNLITGLHSIHMLLFIGRHWIR